jgi:hypothetical protein
MALLSDLLFESQTVSVISGFVAHAASRFSFALTAQSSFFVKR